MLHSMDHCDFGEIQPSSLNSALRLSVKLSVKGLPESMTRTSNSVMAIKTFEWLQAKRLRAVSSIEISLSICPLLILYILGPVSCSRFILS